MPLLFAGVHLRDKSNEFLSLNDIDFDRNVHYLKEEIGKKLQYDATNLELIYNGIALKDENKLLEALHPSATVHCFSKAKQYPTYVPPEGVTSPENITHVQELFNVIAHTQINVNSRINILQKILAEYPEFRRNLGAQALIRDSVLFNALHHPQVVKNISEEYPIICEAAPFMVDTIKKELARSSSTTLSEPATDSTNSSEEENSMSASTSNDRSESGAQLENARIRMISRHQLQTALTRIGVGSVNSLSSIAQRNSDEDNTVSGTTAPYDAMAASSASLLNTNSNSRISASMFRSELQRALESLSHGRNQLNEPGSDNGAQGEETQQMDTSEAPTSEATEEESDDLPAQYRTHQYANELRTMAQMGLLNYEDNLVYLTIASGNIDVAVNLLMGAMN